mmetsp:Transcript_128428/g.363453  ORF Transcript_128428/g.363453 Transcript_128428/m.363453 type:complete len:554 (+) Transcript_128428:1199-2860(+)
MERGQLLLQILEFGLEVHSQPLLLRSVGLLRLRELLLVLPLQLADGRRVSGLQRAEAVVASTADLLQLLPQVGHPLFQRCPDAPRILELRLQLPPPLPGGPRRLLVVGGRALQPPAQLPELPLERGSFGLERRDLLPGAGLRRAQLRVGGLPGSDLGPQVALTAPQRRDLLLEPPPLREGLRVARGLVLRGPACQLLVGRLELLALLLGCSEPLPEAVHVGLQPAAELLHALDGALQGGDLLVPQPQVVHVLGRLPPRGLELRPRLVQLRPQLVALPDRGTQGVAALRQVLLQAPRAVLELSLQGPAPLLLLPEALRLLREALVERAAQLRLGRLPLLVFPLQLCLVARGQAVQLRSVFRSDLGRLCRMAARGLLERALELRGLLHSLLLHGDQLRAHAADLLAPHRRVLGLPRGERGPDLLHLAQPLAPLLLEGGAQLLDLLGALAGAGRLDAIGDLPDLGVGVLEDLLDLLLVRAGQGCEVQVGLVVPCVEVEDHLRELGNLLAQLVVDLLAVHASSRRGDSIGPRAGGSRGSRARRKTADPCCAGRLAAS